MNQSILTKALFPEEPVKVFIKNQTAHVHSNAYSAQEMFASTQREEHLLDLLSSTGVGLESIAGIDDAEGIDYANLGLISSITDKFKAISKYISSLTDFAAWSTDEVKEVNTLLAQVKGDATDVDIKMGGGARFLQLYPTKTEKVEDVLKELREYIVKVLPSEDIYTAIDRYTNGVVDQLIIMASNLTKEARENGDFKLGPTINKELLIAYRDIYFDTVTDLTKVFMANKKIDDGRYGKDKICYVSQVLPANMVVSVPSLQKDKDFSYYILKSELTSMAKTSKWIDMRSIKTNGKFAENLPPLKKSEIPGVLDEVSKLSVVLAQAKDIGKNHMAIEKAIEKAIVRADAIYDEKGIPAFEKVAGRFILKTCRNDAIFMLKAITDLSNLSVEVVESAISLCRKSIKNYE